MTLIEKIISGTITLTELTSPELKTEIVQLVEKSKNAAVQVVEMVGKKIIRTIAKFERKIVIPANTTVDIVKFFTEGIYNDDKTKIANIVHWGNFRQILDAITDNGKNVVVDISNETINEFSNTIFANDYKIMADLPETFIDITTDTGKLEMRKRLAILAYQKKHGLLNNVTIAGWVTMSGSEQCVRVNARGSDLYCGTNASLGCGWDAGGSFLSRNDA